MKIKKSYRRAIGLNVYEENILVTDGEDKVQTSTKYGSKTSEWDSTVKATYQEIYISRRGPGAFVLLRLFMWQICRTETADAARSAVINLAIINTVCRRYVLRVSTQLCSKHI